MTAIRSDALARAGALAAQTLEALFAAVCGEPPEAVRAWRDGDALLLVLAPGERGLDGLDCASLPELIAQAVRSRTGCVLRDGRRHSDAGLGLELFVFRLPELALAGATERPTAWERWSPLPSARRVGGECQD